LTDYPPQWQIIHLILIELEVVASIVVRDVLYHAREALHVVRKQALLYIIA